MPAIELTDSDTSRVDEFQQDTGAAFGLFDLHDMQAAFTRPVFVNHLTQSWLPALPSVQTKLDAGMPVRIAEVDGYDLDDESIAAAQRAAANAGVADRARFECRDAADPQINGNHDLVTTIETLDVEHPQFVLYRLA